MNRRKLLYVFSKAPFSDSQGQETIDAALIGAAFEQDVSLLFLHDGVFQLLRGQDASDSGLKQTSKTYGALHDFDIKRVYVHELSLAVRGIERSDLLIDVELMDSDKVTKLISDQHRVFTF